MQYQKEDTEVVVSLPENSQRYVPSKINNRRNRGNFLLGTKDLDWYLNKFLTENIKMKKKFVLGFFVLETKADIKIKHEMQSKKKQTSSKISKKNMRRQFLNRYVLSMLIGTQSTG